MAVTPVDLYVFGNTKGPRLPRLNIDLIPDAAGMVGPESPPRPLNAASAFANPAKAPVKG